MTATDRLSVALKEWQTVCDALSTGKQVILLRKGGIHESGGEFDIEHRRFLLFPTYVHQNATMLKPGVTFEKLAAEPERLTLSVIGSITEIVPLTDRAQMNALGNFHIWSSALIDMRFSYRSQNPLYLLLVRAHRLPGPVQIENTPAYAGCKSWVPLETPIPVADAIPAIDDTAYAVARNAILSHF